MASREELKIFWWLYWSLSTKKISRWGLGGQKLRDVIYGLALTSCPARCQPDGAWKIWRFETDWDGSVAQSLQAVHVSCLNSSSGDFRPEFPVYGWWTNGSCSTGQDYRQFKLSNVRSCVCQVLWSDWNVWGALVILEKLIWQNVAWGLAMAFDKETKLGKKYFGQVRLGEASFR